MKFVRSKIHNIAGKKIYKVTYRATSQDDLNMFIDFDSVAKENIEIDVDKKELTIVKIVGYIS